MLLNQQQLNEVVLDLEGEPVMRQVRPSKEQMDQMRKDPQARIVLDEVPMTVGWALKNILTMRIKNPDGSELHEDDKFELFKMATGITNAELELKSEDITLIKERMRKIYAVEVYGFIVALLEK